MKCLFVLSVTMFFLALMVTGCGQKSTDDNVDLTGKPANADKAMLEDKSIVVRNSNQFALDLFGKLDKKDNVFFSPASISTALAMTYAGARGQTAEQMANVLHFQLDAKRLHPTFAGLIWEMLGRGKPRGVRLNIANALWGNKGTQFLQPFLQAMKDNYNADLQQVDFARPDDARQVINSWVAQQTADKVKELLQSSDITPLTRLVLTNAVYFKGEWQHSFEGNHTHDQPFHVTPKKDESVPMMHQTGEFLHSADEAKGFQILEMPYKDSELSMVVLLPKEVDGLAELEKKLDADSLMMWMQQMKSKEVVLTMPKFTMRSRLPLADRLKAMGMTAAFRPEEADFAGMSEDKLFVSSVIHEAWVDVNEKGTEAAAATGVVMAARAEPPQQRIVFQADHPFLFLIRDAGTGVILFLGRMSNPKD